MSTYPLRVIVLEDHRFQRAIAVTMLQKMGCAQVFQASNGVQALALLKKVGPVDVALCDLCMDGMDGLEFLQQADELGLVRSVIISSSLPMDLRRTARQLVVLLKIQFLGDVGKPLHYAALEMLLKKHTTQAVVEKPAHWTIAPPSVAEVRRAMTDQEFHPYFQPKFMLQTGEVNGVEVLTRWHHPVHGVLTPAYFMSALEEGGLMDELLMDQLRQSLFLQRQANKKGHGLNIAFNVLATQLANERLVRKIKALLTKFNLSGSGLTFELTESGLLQATPSSLKSLVQLRMIGCKLSIDDFGAGYSSLQRLCQLPFNEIKLDGMFAQNFLEEPRSCAIISSTLALGKALGMSVVIEGIETQEQREQLIALGCTEGQGFIFARPMSSVHLMQWLDERRVSTVE
ncbi:EAL domain-containing response regulator [Pseudomonas sp. L1(2025)]|uniref:EAL domain-containing response regulator n=1 Tax=Pseudomonas sp. L1(2025) TaxID=3449429 RepID=UPI003F693ACC